MSRLALSGAVLLFPMLAACGGQSEPAKGAGDTTIAPPASKPEAATPAAKPADTAAASASAAPADAPPKDAAKPGGVTPFAGEDPGKAVKLTGPRAWTLGEGDSMTLSVYDFVRTDGTKNIFKGFGGEGEFAVPGAFTFQTAPAKGLKKGDPVRVPVVTASECGRVLSVSDTQIKVSFEWGGKVDQRDYQPDEVLPLDGTLSFGAPVAYKEIADDEAWMPGTLLYKDDKSAWLAGNLKVDAKLIRPLAVKKAFKAGDKAIGISKNAFGALSPVTIVKVLDGGLQYEIKYDDGKTATATFCTLTSPIK